MTKRCLQSIGAFLVAAVAWPGVVLACLTWSANALAEANPKSAVEQQQKAERDLRATEQLTRLAPELVPTWREANDAWDRGDLASARTGAESIVAKVPKFSPARRFLAVIEGRSGNVSRAIALAGEVLNDDHDPLSERSAAMVLLSEGTTEANHQMALVHAEAAARAMPGDLSVQAIRCRAAAVTQNLPALASCSDALLRIDPADMAGHYFSFLNYGMRGELEEARKRLDRAHQLGLPDEVYNGDVARLDEARPWLPRAASWFAWAVGSWLVVVGLALGIAAILSRITLSHATRSAQAGAPRSSDALLRKAYRTVLAFSCVLYYASIPLLTAMVLAIAGGIILAFFALGHVPIKLVAIIGFFGLSTAWVVLRSLFVRRREVEPGTPVDLSANPRLRETLDEVAKKVGTRPVDTVYLTPGTEVAVFERGGIRAGLRGTGERCLVLGAGVLEGMDLLAFKAVLAHEYGHFKNEDTAGGAFSLAVRRSMVAMAMGLATSGMATWYNPAWHFVNQFHKVFLRISHGATRLQEILADRWAAFAYGSHAFARGLDHVIRRSVAFDVHVQRTLDEVIERKLPLANLYAYAPAPIADLDQEIAAAAEKLLTREASHYDSHPPPKDRIAWVHALAVEHDSADRQEGAWALFAARAEVEAAMTNHVRARIEEQHGVVIPVAAPSPPNPAPSPSEPDAVEATASHGPTSEPSL